MNYYEFLNALAWVFGVASTGPLIIRIVSGLCYTERKRLYDLITYGYERNFPLLWPSVIAVVCWLHIWKVTP